MWAWDRNFYQEDFARYVDAVAADEVTRRATATAGRRDAIPASVTRRLRRHSAGGNSDL